MAGKGAPHKTRRTLPAVWMRAGTSKGLFLHMRDLPPTRADWAPVILSAMGSQDSDPRQLSGIGGATSTTSKVAVIAPSNRPDVDVEYTFIQVSIGNSILDFTGNCGNIASGVGPFAVDEGLLHIQPGQKKVDVRILNTNTSRMLTETLIVDGNGCFIEDGDYRIPGTFSPGSLIQVAFEEPSGAMTGMLFPSGQAADMLSIPSPTSCCPYQIRVSAVDAANPFIFVDGSTIPEDLRSLVAYSTEYLEFIETVRRHGAVLMGLATDVDTAALTRGTPKIAVLSAPVMELLDVHGEPLPDVEVTAFSMGKVHGSIQLTGAVCLGTAICTRGTIASEIAQRVKSRQSMIGAPARNDSFTNITTDISKSTHKVKIRHPGGDMDVKVELCGANVERVTLSRTARRLFQGSVCYLA